MVKSSKGVPFKILSILGIESIDISKRFEVGKVVTPVENMGDYRPCKMPVWRSMKKV